MRLTAKQEKFAQLLFQGVTQYDAYMQTYSPTDNRNIADVAAHRVASSSKIRLRLAELSAKAESETVATVIERKERLSEFIREDIVSKTGNLIRISNIASIQELNKMDKLYSEGGNTYNDIKVLIVRERPKELEDAAE